MIGGGGLDDIGFKCDADLFAQEETEGNDD